MSKKSSAAHPLVNTVNRPVHLARRDAHFERAVELVSRPLDHLSSDQRRALLSLVLECLRTSRRHAFFAMCPAVSANEKDFLRFLDLKIDTVRSARSMIDHQILLEEQAGFLRNFLRAEPAQFQLPAMHFQRRAEDILHGLWHLIRLAHSPFHALREEARKSFTTEQGERYLRAYRHVREEVEKRFPVAPPE